MPFSNQEKINNSDKLPSQIVGTANDAPGTKWWYNEALGLLFITDPEKIWMEFSSIPGAATPALADVAVTANPTLLEKRAVHLTLDPTSNNRSWTARETYGDLTTDIYGNWVQPSLIRDSGDPSYGYSIRLYNGVPGGGGVELPTSYLSGAGGAPSWQWNYAMGVLVVSTDQSAAYVALDLWVEGYRYIGPTGSGGGAICEETRYVQSFTNQTAVTVPHNLSSRNLLVKIRDDGTDDFDITGLASSIVYTHSNAIDITFPSSTSGTVVVGYFDHEVFQRTFTFALSNTHRHAFNKNHIWSIYDNNTYDDLRYAPHSYQFVDSDYDSTVWVTNQEITSTLVDGLCQKKITEFDSSSTWTFEHNLASKDYFVVCQDSITGVDITSMANTIQYNEDTVVVNWASPQAGRIIVGF